MGPASGLVLFLIITAAAFIYIEVTRKPVETVAPATAAAEKPSKK